MSKFYIVINGVKPTVYFTWDECSKNVVGVKNVKYKSFKLLDDAKYWCLSNNVTIDDFNSLVGNVVNLESTVNIGLSKISYDNYDLVIYTDGSCQKEIGGCGILFIDNTNGLRITDKYSIKMDEYPTTNNRAELYAIYNAIILYNSLQKEYKSIVIITDSQYSIDCINVYYDKWSKNGWRLNNGLMPSNLDIIHAIKMLICEIPVPVVLNHVMGHSNDKYNAMVDLLAKQAIVTQKSVV